MERKKISIIIAVVFILIYILFSTSHFFTDYFWYKSLNVESVFWKIFNTKILLWITTFLVYFGFIYVNLRVSLETTKNRSFQINLGQYTSIDFNKLIKSGVALISIILAFMFAAPAMELWEKYLKFQNAHTFNLNDPVFHKDISFYFFYLPFILSIKNILFGAVFLSIIMATTVYVFKGSIQLVRGWYKNFAKNVRIHLGVLIIVLLGLFAVHFWLLRYDILYSRSGVVFGAGYTDTHAKLFGFTAVSIMFFISMILVLSFIISKKSAPLFIWGAVHITGIFIFLLIVPLFQQKFLVEPYELEKERPFIQNNINLTRIAYGLDKVNREEYNLDNILSPKQLETNRSTLQNIRLWDWRPLLNTYRQIQELRMYYTFEDVDIDRYHIDGDYKQLMLSVRELDYSQMPSQAKTWVNQRIRYTHGYGVVASQVSVVTKEGLPDLVVKDIPPVSVPDIKVDRPGIYYGEKTNDYIFIGTTMDEFDYPVGEKNKLTRYNGLGGVSIGSIWMRALFAMDTGSIKFLISKYFTKDTKILYNRNIFTIVKKIAPFLRYDADPYIAIIDGKLKWILDAYTTGNMFPYSEPVEYGLNYIRNSVKVVIDAYDGTADFYIIDKNDPVINTYLSIFPEIFKSSTEIPPNIKKHFRYPVDLFIKQSVIYQAYHMTTPEVFYNREDVWKFPREIYQGHEEIMSPYYTIMQLDGKTEEFLLILPFTPANKNNMIAWLAAGSDGDSYGKLNLYEFPKKELVYGPMQIEARIDQTPEISEVLTLWNQQGSSVIRGNLLVIPISHSLLYIEPLYLQAEKSKMPELKRVIVSYKNRIVMRESLDECLQVIFNLTNLSSQSTVSESKNLNQMIKGALKEFDSAQKALQQGNWSEYGRHQNEVESLLRQLQKFAR